MTKTKPSKTAARQLATFFERNGYVRRADRKRIRKEGRDYKKGDEVRLIAESKAELAQIRKLLKQSGFKVGRAYAQRERFRQPIYGREAVSQFLALIGKD